MKIGQPAPEFNLPDLTGQLHRLSDTSGLIVLVNFWSAECPHSQRTDAALVSALKSRAPAASFISIASNRNEPIDLLRREAARRHLPLVLLDQDHAVADLYEAIATPHVFILDERGILRYQGAVDDAIFGQTLARRNYVQEALEALQSGRSPSLTETPAFGCAIVREI